MRNALIVSENLKAADAIKHILADEGYAFATVAATNGEVKSFLENQVFDLVFVNTPLKDESGLPTALYAAQNTRSCVVVAIAKESITHSIVEKCTLNGMLVIQKPINRHLFHHYLMFTECLRGKMQVVMQENDKLKSTVEEIRIINRAKYLLIETLSMTETQAHRYIEKQAMDMRVTKLEVAKQIIKTYGS